MSRTRLVVAAFATLALAACAAPTEPRTSRFAAPTVASADSIPVFCRNGYTVINGRCE